jgi:UDP-N-acetylmuramoyl-tripeptide--D-alanyl-D-alanine ligase
VTWAVAALCALAAIPAGLRWLRIAQREHYLAPSVTRFALRWWRNGPLNMALSAVALIGVFGSLVQPWLGLMVPLAQIGPIGLSIRGRSSPLAWTPRLRRLAVTSAVLTLGALVGGVLSGWTVLVTGGLVVLPMLVDLALALLSPVERRVGERWVAQATARLRSSGAKVVAITGSYGKTTTKQYVAHLLEGSRRTVASPASFNNRMGLARAVNEHLVPGTEVFVAEMGTYGPGEIAELCSWVRPEVSAIVSVGPVHLERFGSEERIVSAKAEILDGARVGVIAVDHSLLAGLARDRSPGMEIIEVSTGVPGSRVSVGGDKLRVDGVEIAAVPTGVFAVDLAVAMGVVLGLGIDPAQVADRVADLPSPRHRQSVSVSDRGFSIIDDTFNSNPAGARFGLAQLARTAPEGRKVLVTPGMVELGNRQFDENRAFAEEAARVADHIVVVGGTNRRALLQGSGTGPAAVTFVASREEAVDWVRESLGPGDAVLYENDLPDHYP